jgi:hypothetical protein
MGERVLEAFKSSPLYEAHPNVDSYFEHGQWWITCLCGAAWSVNDGEGPDTYDGFCFEETSAGDEDYHRDTD